LVKGLDGVEGGLIKLSLLAKDGLGERLRQIYSLINAVESFSFLAVFFCVFVQHVTVCKLGG
jgi:hypothetical protein